MGGLAHRLAYRRSRAERASIGRALIEIPCRDHRYITISCYDEIRITKRVSEFSKRECCCMNGIPIVVAVALVLGIGVVYWSKKRAWKAVYRRPELTEQASDQYALLQDQGIRCRMRSVPIRTHMNAGVAMQGGAEAVETMTVIEIHRNDLDAAQRLLEERVQGQYEFMFEAS